MIRKSFLRKLIPWTLVLSVLLPVISSRAAAESIPYLGYAFAGREGKAFLGRRHAFTKAGATFFPLYGAKATKLVGKLPSAGKPAVVSLTLSKERDGYRVTRIAWVRSVSVVKTQASLDHAHERMGKGQKLELARRFREAAGIYDRVLKTYGKRLRPVKELSRALRFDEGAARWFREDFRPDKELAALADFLDGLLKRKEALVALVTPSKPFSPTSEVVRARAAAALALDEQGGRYLDLRKGETSVKSRLALNYERIFLDILGAAGEKAIQARKLTKLYLGKVRDRQALEALEGWNKRPSRGQVERALYLTLDKARSMRVRRKALARVTSHGISVDEDRLVERIDAFGARPTLGEALKKMKAHRVIPTLLRKARFERGDGRAASILALGAFGRKEHLPVLASLLREDSASKAAAHALLAIGGEEAAVALLRFIGTKGSRGMRSLIARRLKRGKSLPPKELWPLLGEADPGIQEIGLALLRKAKPRLFPDRLAEVPLLEGAVRLLGFEADEPWSAREIRLVVSLVEAQAGKIDRFGEVLSFVVSEKPRLFRVPNSLSPGFQLVLEAARRLAGLDLSREAKRFSAMPGAHRGSPVLKRSLSIPGHAVPGAMARPFRVPGRSLKSHAGSGPLGPPSKPGARRLAYEAIRWRVYDGLTAWWKKAVKESQHRK